MPTKNPYIKVPEGKMVHIELDDGTEIPEGIPLILEDQVQLSASSSFNPLFGGGGGLSNLLRNLTFAGQISARAGGPGFGGSLKQMGMQVWQSTDPLSTNLNFTFYMGIADKWDAYEEVKKPIFELMKLTLPQEGEGGTLIAPGPSPVDIFAGTAFEKGIEGKLNIEVKRISVDIGNIILLPEVIVKKVDPVFSAEVDDYGHPIWGQVSMDIQTLFIATSAMLDESLDETNPENQTLQGVNTGALPPEALQ